jgi:hypothetical protein
MPSLGSTRFAYAAPEMLLGADWDYKADIYSFGVVLWCAVDVCACCRAGPAAWRII